MKALMIISVMVLSSVGLMAQTDGEGVKVIVLDSKEELKGFEFKSAELTKVVVRPEAGEAIPSDEQTGEVIGQGTKERKKDAANRLEIIFKDATLQQQGMRDDER